MSGSADQRAESVRPDSRPPWTEEQVCSLNEFQVSGAFHPFTCGHCRDTDESFPLTDDRILVATADGWICPTCDYTQGWAWPFMADGEWRTSFDYLKRVLRIDGCQLPDEDGTGSKLGGA